MELPTDYKCGYLLQYRVAWQHVHLVGKFDFSKEQTVTDLDALAALFYDPKRWNRAVNLRIKISQANFTFLAGWAQIANVGLLGSCLS